MGRGPSGPGSSKAGGAALLSSGACWEVLRSSESAHSACCLKAERKGCWEHMQTWIYFSMFLKNKTSQVHRVLFSSGCEAPGLCSLSVP